MTSIFKTSKGLQLSFEETGSGEPILAIHGIPTDYRVWSAQVEPFSRTRRMISYSRRYANPNSNQGNLDDSTVENNSSDLLELINGLGLDRVNLIGHSYGGFVAIYAVSKHPEKFKSLILVEPAIPSLLVKNEKNPIQVLSFLLKNPKAASSARRFQSGKLKQCLNAYDQGRFDDAVNFFLEGIYEKEAGDVPAKIREIARDNGKTVGELETEFPVFTKENASSISLPTMLVKGQNSPDWLRAIVDNLSKALPRNKVKEVSNSGHLPHVENPEEFNSIVLEFLNGV